MRRIVAWGPWFSGFRRSDLRSAPIQNKFGLTLPIKSPESFLRGFSLPLAARVVSDARGGTRGKRPRRFPGRGPHFTLGHIDKGEETV